MWTLFRDTYSGGGLSHYPYDEIWVEADRESAERFLRFKGIDVHNVSCECCGSDYTIWENEEPPEQKDPETTLIFSKDQVNS